ncbi:MAG: hypothetical protein CM15mV7_0210 [uncultured marine virus]|nr:MAG: hypothetical protein CM15mV7_0210 [uncultured marine virus]
MSQLKVASIRDLTDARGFSLSGGGISAVGTLTVGNININGQIQGQSTYVIPPQTGNSGKFLAQMTRIILARSINVHRYSLNASVDI